MNKTGQIDKLRTPGAAWLSLIRAKKPRLFGSLSKLSFGLSLDIVQRVLPRSGVNRKSLGYNRIRLVLAYKVVVRHTEEGCTENCPGLAGCWSQGETEQETLANIQDASGVFVGTGKA